MTKATPKKGVTILCQPEPITAWGKDHQNGMFTNAKAAVTCEKCKELIAREKSNQTETAGQGSASDVVGGAID